MPMSLFTKIQIGAAREKGPRGSLHRHRTDGSDVPPFFVTFSMTRPSMQRPHL